MYAIIVLSHVAACMRSLTCTTIIDSVASSPPDVSPVRTREVTRIGLGSAPFIHGGPAFAAGAAAGSDEEEEVNAKNSNKEIIDFQ